MPLYFFYTMVQKVKKKTKNANQGGFQVFLNSDMDFDFSLFPILGLFSKKKKTLDLAIIINCYNRNHPRGYFSHL